MSAGRPILVVAAHPDDEVLGCGGTIARLADAGEEVHIAILGEGITSRGGADGEAERAALAALGADARRAAAILGAREVHLFALPDNRFDTVPLLDVIRPVERLIAALKPRAVLTQHPGDLNVDHAVTARAVLTATRPLPGCPVAAVYGFEVPSSTEYAFSQIQPVFQPQVFIDIAATLERKVGAMEAYRSERRAFPHPRSPGALRAIAARWGSAAGLAAAEAFALVRDVRGGDACAI